MKFETLLKQLETLQYSIEPAGFVNVEGGTIAVATQYFVWCDCSSGILGPPSETCSACGRSASNHLAIPAGVGDGVYVVFAIVNPKTGSNAGAFVVLDNFYGIANLVRQQVQQETWPTFPNSESLEYGHADGYSLGRLQDSDMVLFGDSPIATDSKNATVDIQLENPSEFVAATFAQEIPQDEASVRNWLIRNLNLPEERAERAILFAQGAFSVWSKENSAEEEPPFPKLEFRVLVTMTVEHAARIGLDKLPSIDSWGLLSAQYMAGTASSHVNPMHESTIHMNALLMRELDRAAGDAVSAEVALKNLFKVWTWAFQGVSQGDEECKDFLRNTYKPSVEQVASLLRLRGQFAKANEVISSGRNPWPVADLPNAPSFQRESQGLSGDSYAKPLSSLDGRKCSSCGASLSNKLARYCSSCASQL